MTKELLIVDNSKLMRDLLKELLSQKFDIVNTVQNGVEATTVCKESRPDIVVMEVDLPICNGIEATSRLQGIDPSTTVVICSHDVSTETQKRALDAGADAYVTKPFQRNGLFEAISRATSPE